MSISSTMISSPVKIFLVEEKRNPSTDYFILPALDKNWGEVVRADFSHCPDEEDLKGAAVIFVRYVPQVWAKMIEKMRSHLCRVVFFFDDDVLDLNATKGLAWAYRFKLFRMAAARKSWLRKQGVEIWVSTASLQQKYNDLNPRLVQPGPIASLPAITRRFFYHGSASHMAEIHWLRPLVENLMHSDESFSFEIIGDHEVNRLYRKIPRTSVVHPMSWPSYQGFLAIPGRHVGLAPLLGGTFNTARSYTKFFDITRCGAVGIYPRDSIFSEVVTNDVEGLLVEQAHDAWLEALVAIAGDESRRQLMLQNAQEKMASLNGVAP